MHLALGQIQGHFMIMLRLCHCESIKFHCIIQSCSLILELYLDVLHEGVTLVLVLLTTTLTAG